MRVGELVEILKQYHPDTPVKNHVCYGDYVGANEITDVYIQPDVSRANHDISKTLGVLVIESAVE